MVAGEVVFKTGKRETVTSNSIDKEIAWYILYEPHVFNFDRKIKPSGVARKCRKREL